MIRSSLLARCVRHSCSARIRAAARRHYPDAERPGRPARHACLLHLRPLHAPAMPPSFIDNGNVDVKRAAAAFNSITVDTYRYHEPAFYTPETMSSIIATYHAAGWKHLVNANATPGLKRAAPQRDHRPLAALQRSRDRRRHRPRPRPSRHEPHPGLWSAPPSRSHSPQRPLRHPQGRSQRRHGPRPRRQIAANSPLKLAVP